MTTKEWLERHDRQVAAHDRQIKAIRDLVQQGIRLVVETRKDMRAVLQRVDRLVKTMERGTNGHPKTKLDLQ